MKKHIVLFSLLVAIFGNVFPITAFGQQDDNQYAIFNWRNDGDFNAFLNYDVDSITYSKIDLNGRRHSNVVVQEIWTPDSLYRIPLAAIDSITFRAPEPILKEGIFHITLFHFPYVIEATETTVTFDASIPSDSLPSVGQVVVSDIAYDEPFVNGFAGRVTRIVRTEGVVIIECEEVSIEDIYDELICVGKVVTYNDSSSTPRAPRRFINEQGEQTIPFGTFSLNLFEDDSNEVTLDVSPKITFEYAIRYKLFDSVNNRFRFVIKKELDCDFDWKWEESFEVDTVVYPHESLKIHTPIFGLNAFVNIGGYLDFNGSASLDLTQHFKLVSQFGYDSRERNNGRDGLVFGFDGTGFDSPNGSVNLHTSLSAGLAFQVGVCLFTEDIAGANLTMLVGPKVSGDIEFNTNMSQTPSWYDFKDSRLTFEPLTANLSGGVNIFSFNKDWELWELPISSWFPVFEPRYVYLFPEFTAPALPDLGTNGYSLTALTTDISRNLLFTVTPGIGLYDSNNQLKYTYFSTKTYKRGANWNNKDLQMELNGNYPVGTYTAKPIFKIWNRTVEAAPASVITVPEPLSIPESIIVKNGETEIIDLNGGWGNYTLTNSESSICRASFVSNDTEVGTTWPPTIGSGYENQTPKVKLTALKNGTATLKVKDARANYEPTVGVTVYSGQMPSITVNPSLLSFSGVPNGAYIDGFTVTGTKLIGDLTLTLNDNTGFFAIGTTSITAAQAAAGVMVDVQYRPATAGTHNATITISDGTVTETVALRGTATPPPAIIIVNPSSLSFSGVPNGAYLDGFTVTGTNLTNNLTLTLNDNTGFFTIGTTSISVAQAAAGAIVDVQYSPMSAGTHNASVTISDGTITETVILTGTAIEPLSVTPSTLYFSNVVTNTTVTKTFMVKGYTEKTLTLSLLGTSSYYTLSRTTITPAQALSGVTVTVTYKPTSAGTHNATVNIGDGTTTNTVALNGTAVTPTITVNPSSLSFSGVPNGAYLDGFTVTGSNLTSSLTLTLNDNSGFFTIDRTSISAAQAAAGASVEVQYRPTSNLPSHSATVTISGGGAQPQTVTLYGSAIEPLTVTPTSLTFSNVVTNTTVTKTFTVKGYTASSLTLSLSGTSGYYSLSRTTITPAQALSGATVTVTYKPTSAGTHNATVNISNGMTVSLKGTAVTPTITVNPSSLSFSGVPNGAYLDGFTVRGANLTGNLTLTLSGATGVFSIDRTSISASQASTGVGVEVQYRPTSAGTHRATITISGGGAQSQTITLIGNANEPLTVTPTSLTFSNVVTNTTVTKTFTVKGYTASSLTLSLSGTSGYYSLSRTTITPAQALSGATVTVTYKPTLAGAHNATVNISNGMTVSLKGTAVTPTITVNPSSLSFSGVPNGAYLDGFTVRGTNLTGNLTLKLEDNSGCFSIDRTSITAAQAAAGASVEVQYNPQKAGRSLAKITISSDGAESKTVTLLGICSNP